MTTKPPSTAGSSADLDQASAWRLLCVGLGGAPRPVDELIGHLHNVPAAGWLETALDQGPARGLGSSAEMLLQGRASAEQIRSVKEKSKQLLKKSIAPQDRLAAMAGYFLSIAAAIVHHRTVPSDRPLADIREVLIDLATAAPEPWSELLGRATIILEDMIGGSGRAERDG